MGRLHPSSKAMALSSGCPKVVAVCTLVIRRLSTCTSSAPAAIAPTKTRTAQVEVAGKTVRVYVYGAPVRDATGAATGAPASVLKYKLQIGSPDGFERKMEEAQSQLGWPLADHVPVVYSNAEFSWTAEALKMAPTLLLIAVIVWTSRSTMRSFGAGGGGGSAHSSPVHPCMC